MGVDVFGGTPGKPGTPVQGPNNTGGDQTENPTPGGNSTTKANEGPRGGNNIGGNQIVDPKPGSNNTVTPISESPRSNIVFNAPGHPPRDLEKDPFIGGAQGVDDRNIGRINDVLAGGTDISIPGRGASGTRNIVSSPGSSMESDFDYLPIDGDAKRINARYGPGKMALLPDGTRIVYRPGSLSTGDRTIEVQRPDGKTFVEIRYPNNHE
ncbi:hypothetical protein AVKW3434_23525 [Acidovorax sp. SUPP3434]|uniref:hypothetical protein n=1 Tax=Acidovorax sp. SUPP3434 TaxID=2920880 RepID=UPI0023DE1C5B|nr:hypothetical protein [Acidovorax sp. SUPP3434]GKT02416.1 hypothetical protein AVKW3434_23525 [Acidovorax sp. SUPP3434]